MRFAASASGTRKTARKRRPNVPKRKVGKAPNSRVAMSNAAKWNNGGYQEFQKGDAAREKAQPIGAPVKRSNDKR